MGKLFYFTVACLFISFQTHSQAFNLSEAKMCQEEKHFYEQNKTLGGDVKIISSKNETKGDFLLKTFQIESKQAGEYYLSAWMSVPLVDGQFQEYKIIVNGVEQKYSIKPESEGWQGISISNTKKSKTAVNLKTGINTVSIQGIAPEFPNVEYIKLSKSSINNDISDTNYREYIHSLNDNSKTSQPVLLQSRSLPAQDYNYALNIPIYYTHFNQYFFAADNEITITTSSNNISKYIIDFYMDIYPTTNYYSFSKIVTTGSDTWTILVPITFGYTIRVRPYTDNISGTVNISVTSNGVTYTETNRAVAGYYVPFKSGYNANTDVNIFTSSMTNADSRLYEIGYHYQTLNYNDDFSNPTGDFNWRYNARFNTLQTTSDKGAFVCGWFSLQSPGNCDIYVGLKNCNNSILSQFSNLKPVDAIQSAPQSSSYNSFGWSVGETNINYNPGTVNPTDPLAALDQFYSSYGYTRSKDFGPNSVIAVWTTGYNNYTHAAVRKHNSGGTEIPHGYDWESKIGDSYRIMHPKDALSGTSFGSIIYYYQIKTSRSVKSASKPTIEKISLNDNERFTVQNFKNQAVSSISTEFDKLYEAWKTTWNRPEVIIHSDPRKYAESDEYAKLLNFCRKYGKVTWPMFIEKLNEGDTYNINLLQDLTYADNSELVKEVSDNAMNNMKNNKIIPTVESIALSYAKKLLNKNQVSILNDIKTKSIDSGIFDFDIATSPSLISLSFNLISQATVTVKVHDIYGNSIANSEVRKSLPSGRQVINISASNMKSGIYFVTANVNNETVTKKISIN